MAEIREISMQHIAILRLKAEATEEAQTQYRRSGNLRSLEPCDQFAGMDIGCPPGIRTPICCSRGSCPTIERGGNAANKKPADSPGFSIIRAGPNSGQCDQIRSSSSLSTCNGFWPRIRKLAAQPVTVANYAVPTRVMSG